MKVLVDISKYAFILCFCMMGFTLGAQSILANKTKVTEHELPSMLKYYKPEKALKQLPSLVLRNPMNELGFVCKWEHNNDKKTVLPLRLRLGTLDYVNKLEGK